jgi:superfamily II DNA/RNA helicase
MDEADRILKLLRRLEGDVKMSPQRTTDHALSATQTKQIQDLARLLIHQSQTAVRRRRKRQQGSHHGKLEQGYVTCPSTSDFAALTFEEKTRIRKYGLFVELHLSFHAELLNYIDIPVLTFTDDKTGQTHNYVLSNSFQKAKTAILLCTDVAGSRIGYPRGRLIIQYDPPGCDPLENTFIVLMNGPDRNGSTGSFVLTPGRNGISRYLKRPPR